MTMKMRLKVKNRYGISQGNDINWSRPRLGHNYTKYKICLSMIMVICIKQQLSNIWSSIHEKQIWGWVEKKRVFKSSGGFIKWLNQS